jgi:hypothetical protein
LRNFLAITALLLLTQQFVNASPIFNEFNTDILEVNGATATVKNSDDILIGSSGVVIHTFKSGVSTIVARADVTSKEGERATIKFEEFKQTEQEAFPKPGILPIIGDKVKLNYLYDRVLIVAPNYDVYKEVTEHFKDTQWIHPDIVAAYLAKEYRPNPDKEIFQKVCAINSASLIYFALSENGYFVDCNNFKTIKALKTEKIKKAQVPFYTRITGIETTWVTWAGKEITDYDAYYRNLIGQ